MTGVGETAAKTGNRSICSLGLKFNSINLADRDEELSGNGIFNAFNKRFCLNFRLHIHGFAYTMYKGKESGE